MIKDPPLLVSPRGGSPPKSPLEILVKNFPGTVTIWIILIPFSIGLELLSWIQGEPGLSVVIPLLWVGSTLIMVFLDVVIGIFGPVDGPCGNCVYSHRDGTCIFPDSPYHLKKSRIRCVSYWENFPVDDDGGGE